MVKRITSLLISILFLDNNLIKEFKYTEDHYLFEYQISYIKKFILLTICIVSLSKIIF